EMLVQSHAGEIHLLPALPDAWQTGHITGLRARGGFEVDVRWKNGKLTKAVIVSDNAAACKLRYASRTTEHKLKAGQTLSVDGKLKPAH
ncbi:MAG: glycoside hydrolase family 95 protein, partial [Planctomycetes bacterium]|nr:glycoside hydrolase family 95 protein [Planctomycetota bacterium]